MQRAASDMSLPVLPDKTVQDIIGLGLPEAIESLYPHLSLAANRALQQRYSACFVESDQTPSALFPGVMETLTCLRDRGHSLAVATGKSRRGLDRVLAGLQLVDFFHASRCADETASKPHPLMLEELLGEFSQASEAAVMVGDTEFDMAMARNAKVPRIAVSYGAHHVDRLRPYQPLACIDQFDELLTVAAW